MHLLDKRVNKRQPAAVFIFRQPLATSDCVNLALRAALKLREERHCEKEGQFG